MILIEGEKYACVQCIRGHRSSTCKHTKRPLVQVRSRGRPMQSINYRFAVLAEDINKEAALEPPPKPKGCCHSRPKPEAASEGPKEVKTETPSESSCCKRPSEEPCQSPKEEPSKGASLCGKGNVIVLRASKRRIVQNDLSAVALSPVELSGSEPQKKMQSTFRSHFGLPDNVTKPRHGSMCACCNSTNKVSVFKLEKPKEEKASPSETPGRSNDLPVEYFYAPSCSIPGSCACDDNCECEGCIAHNNSATPEIPGYQLTPQPHTSLVSPSQMPPFGISSHSLNFSHLNEKFYQLSREPVETPIPSLLGYLDSAEPQDVASANAISIAEYEWVLDDCICSAEGCWCYNCVSHDIVNGIRQRDGVRVSSTGDQCIRPVIHVLELEDTNKKKLYNVFNREAEQKNSCCTSQKGALAELHALDLECTCPDNACHCDNCYKHGIINGIKDFSCGE
ncbi:hypothetical protein BABINDRAFT_91184 [Babjeviella inositovora NRRL Y-12698]|uniref:Copper-fist domain-containing protein n=1 Tax=Babjeviella inositovora NRRL Y-12698 TaxID=984486 RepID=A0A1E3QJX9_9ASCO|nr:uncharacterized protein BABINDRAFT_91184 [Babjeviella inositovora NRRL Y-12698]ODQ77996.1 hypothetical protein BABINDRAFT_91184 [Babjeviella inositovora NRRL Y-12698]